MKRNETHIKKQLFPRIYWVSSLLTQAMLPLFACGNISLSPYVVAPVCMTDGNMCKWDLWIVGEWKAIIEEGYTDDRLIDCMILRKDTFHVSQDVMARSISPFCQSARIDSIVKEEGINVFLKNVGYGLFVSMPSEYTIEEEKYYVSLLFWENLFFAINCETGYYYQSAYY